MLGPGRFHSELSDDRRRDAGARIRRMRIRSLGLIAALGLGLASRSESQARPPLVVTTDSTGALSAIRAIDLRQICRCPVVLIDSVVRRSPRIRIFEVLEEPPAFRLSPAAIASLRLTGHRAIGTALVSLTAARKDTALLAAQQVPTPPPNARFLVAVTPPTGITAAYLVSLSRRRAAWRVEGVRSVLEP